MGISIWGGVGWFWTSQRCLENSEREIRLNYSYIRFRSVPKLMTLNDPNSCTITDTQKVICRVQRSAHVGPDSLLVESKLRS